MFHVTRVLLKTAGGRLHDIDHAWISLASFMHRFVQRRKQELRDNGGIEKGERGDLFSRLVAASDGIEKFSLDEQEVVRINYSD